MAVSLEDFQTLVGMALTNSHGHHPDLACTDCALYTAGIVELFKRSVKDTYALGAHDGAIVAREGNEGMAKVMRSFLDAMPTGEDPYDPTP